MFWFQLILSIKQKFWEGGTKIPAFNFLEKLKAFVLLQSFNQPIFWKYGAKIQAFKFLEKLKAFVLV